MVNIEDNSLYYAALGGVIIGIATSLNYAFRGSVTGMSGMLYSTVTLDKIEMPKNIAIIGGMLLIGGIFFDIFEYGTFNKFTPFGPESEITIYTSQLGFALAGILVGFGTKLSNGCTSGHGLCGLARLSIRSLVAVITFLVSGLAIATIAYHAGGLGPFTQERYSSKIDYDHSITSNICIALGILLPFIGLYMRIYLADQSLKQLKPIVGNTSTNSTMELKPLNSNSYFAKDQFVVFLVGLIFGAGLLVAGMVRRSNIIGFLALGKNWNPSLMFVLGAGLLINLIFFTYMIRVRKQPIIGQKLFNPNNSMIDLRLVSGAICFGLGWGIGGLCPGPAIMQTPIFTVDVHLIWFPFFFLGQFIANKINQVFPPQNATGNIQLQKSKDFKETPNSIVEDSLIIVKESGSPNDKIDRGNDLFLTRKSQRMGQILHQHGTGHIHANKLPHIQPVHLKNAPQQVNPWQINQKRTVISRIENEHITPRVVQSSANNHHNRTASNQQAEKKLILNSGQRNSNVVVEHIH